MSPPGVSDELEALRAASPVKMRAARLSGVSGGLSTPEKEEEAIRAAFGPPRTTCVQKRDVITVNLISLDKKKKTKKVQPETEPELEAQVEETTPVPEEETTPAPVQEESQAPVEEPTPAPEEEEATPAPIETESKPTPEIEQVEEQARQAMASLGIKPVEDVGQIALKRKGGIFTIFKPDVYEKNGSYFIFGKAKLEKELPVVEEKCDKSLAKNKKEKADKKKSKGEKKRMQFQLWRMTPSKQKISPM